MESFFATDVRRAAPTIARGEAIGNGTTATVVRAPGESVCTKVVTGPARASALCEITLLTALAHPNVVAAPAIEYTRDSVNFHMKYYSTSLRSWCGVPENTDETVRQLAGGVALGLAYIHARGVIHCDLKPDNIHVELLEDGTLRPVIADFGSAMLTCSPRTTYDLQTPLYRAPEMVVGARPWTGIDVWSLGVIILELHGWKHVILPGKGLDNYRADFISAARRSGDAVIGGCICTDTTTRLTAADVVRTFGWVNAPVEKIVSDYRSIDSHIRSKIRARTVAAVGSLGDGITAIKLAITGQIASMTERDIDRAARLSCAAGGLLLR